jgi:hypothetical protein
MKSFYIPIATVTVNGVVSTTTQTFAGDKTFNGNIYGLNFYNRTSSNNAALTLATTGATIAHNVADANTALTVTNSNASSTGAIVEFKWNGTTKFQVTATGSTVVNKDTNDSVHALKVGQNHASSTGNILTMASVGADVTSFNKAGKINLYAGAAPTDAKVLVGVTSTNVFDSLTLTQGNNVSFTQAASTFTISVSLTPTFTSATLNGTGTGLFVVGTVAATYRTTNGGTGLIAQTMFDVDNSTTTAGAQAFAFDSVGGFIFTHANGTRRIMGAAIKLSNLTNTAGSEASDLIFQTQTGGTAAATRLTITAAGVITIATAPSAGSANFSYLSRNTSTGNIETVTQAQIMATAATTATDANTTISTPFTFYILPTITAARTLTLPSASTAGQEIIVWNKNTSGTFLWTFASTVFDAASATITTIVNTSFYRLISDGTRWVKSN